MSRAERLIYEKLCLSCADKLRAAKFAAEEQDGGGDGYGICRLCQARGVFSGYKVYKLRSEREGALIARGEWGKPRKTL